MNTARKSDSSFISKTVGGFDKNHFSKPILLAYSKNYIQYRDLIAVHQIEDAVIAIGRNGMKVSQYRYAFSQSSKKLPTSYAQVIMYKFNLWVDHLTNEKIVVGAILDLIVDGKSFVAVDRRFHKANGWAKKNFVKGIQFWNINDF